MLQDTLKVRGNLTIQQTTPEGETFTVEVKNLVVTVGKEFLASRAAGNTPAVMSHMAIGSGTTAAVLGDTTLQTELARVALTISASSNVITHSATFGEGVGTGPISEAAIFNAASGGDMMARTVFPVVNKAAGDVFSITWQITIG